MRNLAGFSLRHTDAYIEDELTEACIPIESRRVPDHPEIKTTLYGRTEQYVFERVWSYWIVHGPVPIETAWEMYNDPRGEISVRVAGHCGCPEPVDPWIRHREAGDVVDEYHIDTQDGLNLFAEKVLGARPLPPTEEEKEEALEIARTPLKDREGDGNARVWTTVYEDAITEEQFLDAAMEIRVARNEISHVRHRLWEISKSVQGQRSEYDRDCKDAEGALTCGLVSLYALLDPEDGRSYPKRAEYAKKRLDDLYAHPEKYILQEKRDG